MLSECCDAPPAGECQYDMGIIFGMCSACFENADFYDENADEVEE